VHGYAIVSTAAKIVVVGTPAVRYQLPEERQNRASAAVAENFWQRSR